MVAGDEYEFSRFVWALVDGIYTARAEYKNTYDPNDVISFEATVTFETTVDPTCEGPGERTYYAVYDGHNATITQIISSNGHDYRFTGFEWTETEDGYTARAVYTCSRDESHAVSYQADVSSRNTVFPTCETAGELTYTASFEDHFDEKTVTVPASGHSYQFTGFEWTEAGDGYTAKAVYVCSKDSDHVQKYESEVTAEITTPAASGSAGVMTYTAEYGGNTDIREVVIPALPEEIEIPEDAPTVVIESKQAYTGKNVDVTIRLRNNPGIASMMLKVSYDDRLTLTNIVYGTEMGGQTIQPQSLDANPVTLNWINYTADSNGDFLYATLTFAVSDTAPADGTALISATYDPENLYNISEENISFYVEDGVLEIKDYMPGDINGDGTLNNKDVTRLFQYVSEWDVEVVEDALDVNGDGTVNNKDVTRLFQYVSGWDVDIF